MSICPVCMIDYPDTPWPLVVNVIINGIHRRMCPMCYGKEHKKFYGKKWKPSGLIAKEMLKQAIQQQKLQLKK
jgi:hypothetical protein